MSDRQLAVVGGGIMGASAAYHLTERTNATVTVFEKGSLASETTFKSAAGFRIIGPSAEMEMKRYGLGLYNEFYNDVAANGGYNLIGRLQLASTEEKVSELRSLADRTPFAEYLSANRLKKECFLPELNFDAVEGGLYFPNAGRFLPHELALEFVSRARVNGAEFRENTKVKDIYLEGNSVVGLETSKGEEPVDTVVCAAGPWNNQVAGMVGIDLPLRQTLAPVLKLVPETELAHTLPNVLLQETGFYTVGLRDGSVLISQGRNYEDGEDRIPPEVDDEVSEEFERAAFSFAAELLPAAAKANIEDQWVGLKSRTPDEMPIIGATGVNGFYMAAFHVQGIQMAPAAGDIIARQIMNSDPTEHYEEVSITRFDGYSDTLREQRYDTAGGKALDGR